MCFFLPIFFDLEKVGNFLTCHLQKYVFCSFVMPFCLHLFLILLGICIGALSALEPSRKNIFAKYAAKAMIAGILTYQH
jgi:nucleoside permease NupC